jgi:hypothetical protein
MGKRDDTVRVERSVCRELLAELGVSEDQVDVCMKADELIRETVYPLAMIAGLTSQAVLFSMLLATSSGFVANGVSKQKMVDLVAKLYDASMALLQAERETAN